MVELEKTVNKWRRHTQPQQPRPFGLINTVSLLFRGPHYSYIFCNLKVPGNINLPHCNVNKSHNNSGRSLPRHFGLYFSKKINNQFKNCQKNVPLILSLNMIIYSKVVKATHTCGNHKHTCSSVSFYSKAGKIGKTWNGYTFPFWTDLYFGPALASVADPGDRSPAAQMPRQGRTWRETMQEMGARKTWHAELLPCAARGSPSQRGSCKSSL